MPAIAAVRWALYADLGMLFGIPAAAWLVDARFALIRLRPALLIAALAGLPLVVLGFLLTVAGMTDTALAEIDRGLVLELVGGTAMGWAFLARLVACAVAAVLCFARPPWIVLPAAVTVAGLAWTGHGASGEGLAGWVRLCGDVLHLLAASTWIGALVLFLSMLAGPVVDVASTARALSRFAGVGTALVGVLVVSGIGNMAFLAAPQDWPTMIAHPYGRLLMVKLLIFAGMLGLAALNRFRLAPRLADGAAIASLRRSVAVELAMGLAVLLLVAWLGLLDPMGP